MRVRLVLVGQSLLATVLWGEGFTPCRRLSSDVPSDARITAVRQHPLQSEVVVLTVESDSFDPVPEGNLIPEWSPTLRTHHYGHVEPSEDD